MGANKFKIFKETDEVLIKNLAAICEECAFQDKGSLVVHLVEKLQQPLKTPVTQIETDERLKALFDCSSSIAWRTILNINNAAPNITISIDVTRQEFCDDVVVNIPDPTPSDLVIKVLSASHKNLRAYSRTESTDKVLGDELAEFYRKREKGLLQLEGLTQRLIDQNEKFRVKLDDEFLTKRNNLEEEFTEHKVKVDEEVAQKKEELEKRGGELDAKIKDLDDSSNTHARRKLRQELKAIISERNINFSLTKATSRKRNPVHLSFVVTIALLGYFSYTSLVKFSVDVIDYESWGVFMLSSTKSFATIAGFVFMAIYYIRWNAKWSDSHAEEEFRLKRLDLDIDRASWVVEMALEWQKEKNSVIPPELIEPLTQNLFEDRGGISRTTHPHEDLLAALLGASSGLKVDIPGVGQVDLDRKSVKDFTKSREKAKV